MKTIVNENQTLIKFYVAVLYKWHPYFPTKIDNISSISEEDRKRIEKDATAVKTLLLSSTVTSDLIEFAKYKFGYKVYGEDFKERLLNNFLDSYSRNIVGSNFRDLQKTESSLVFQKSSEKIKLENNPENYFGAISFESNQIYMINVPENIWKIEIYEKPQKKFIEYSVKKALGGFEINSEPILTIELGPEASCYNNYEYISKFYYNFDSNNVSNELDENLYNKLETSELADEKYLALRQEITDSKVFYIVQTPEKISSVNISLSSWNSSQIPHRNKKDWNVTNDYFLGTVTNNYNVFTSKYDNSLIDTSSMILLGNQKIELEKNPCPLPLLKEKINRCNEGISLPDIEPAVFNKKYKKDDEVIYNGYIYISLKDENIINEENLTNWKKSSRVNPHTHRRNVVYNLNDKVTYKGGIFISLIDGNIFDNPETSGYWTRIDENGSILNKIKNNKNCKEVTIISNNGNVYPNGFLSIKTNKDGSWEKSIEIEEQLGYIFISLLINYRYLLTYESLRPFLGDNQDSGKYSISLDQKRLSAKINSEEEISIIEFIFSKITPVIDLIFEVENDYKHNNGAQNIYINEYPDDDIYLTLNGLKISNINNGISLQPNEKYNIKIHCNNEVYNLLENQKTEITGIVDKNKTKLVFKARSREYMTTFVDHYKNKIVINGDSTKMCYYGQEISFEFSFEDDNDAKILEDMKECIFIKIKNDKYTSLRNWINSRYKISLEGGGINPNTTTPENNYILTIKNIDQDFDIKYITN
jgi:hypothetical protein